MSKTSLTGYTPDVKFYWAAHQRFDSQIEMFVETKFPGLVCYAEESTSSRAFKVAIFSKNHAFSAPQENFYLYELDFAELAYIEKTLMEKCVNLIESLDEFLEGTCPDIGSKQKLSARVDLDLVGDEKLSPQRRLLNMRPA